MKFKAITHQRMLSSALGAALATLCGLVLWQAPVGEWWIGASYDYLFRFGTRPVTNAVSFIMMDNEAFEHYEQTRDQPWDRALHAQLLNKLADDGCRLVVMDCFFGKPHQPAQDEALISALRRQQHVVLMAEQSQVTYPTMLGMHPTLPAEKFYSAAGTNNWGVAWLAADDDLIIRRLWPFPAPGPYPSLPETAARLEGAPLGKSPCEQWLRYYGQHGTWPRLSYGFAMKQPKNYFRNQVVFIGNEPKTSSWDGEPDEFCTPYTRWTGETTAGGEIMLTSFLNLVNREWLRRPDQWLEALILVFSGIVLGGGLRLLRLPIAFACAAGFAVTVLLGAVVMSYFSNYWFPWLVIAGGQLPCALMWAIAFPKTGRSAKPLAPAQAALAEELPVIPDYELLSAPFGQGAYGKVWLARTAAGPWCAVKVIYLADFRNDVGPFEREFNGISRYQAISDKHPSLLRVDFVSQKFAGHFYYVMELGDAVEPGWEQEPSKYKPRDLASECARRPGSRLPARECLNIGIELCDALDFLHRQGLTHRDIKPQNILFVNGRLKLADLGLIAEIRPAEQNRTLVGTPGYMPPPPELPGTPQADIYALGIVLYVLNTGSSSAFFPGISSFVRESADFDEFFIVNAIIVNACQLDPAHRYASASEMKRALQGAQKILKSKPAG